MPLANSDIVIRLSGGAGNSDPNSSLGGIISSTVLTDNSLHNLFDRVAGSESTAGDTEYRGVYILNNHGSLTLIAPKIWVSSETSHTGEDIEIALAGEGVNATMETVANESTAPVGETFSDASSEGAALPFPADLAAGQRMGVWIKRVTDPATLAKNNYTIVLSVKGDTQE